MKILQKTSFFILIFIQSVAAQNAEKLSVHANFEGGSVKVVSIDQIANEIKFKPGGDSLRGWPCWWYFRIDGIEPGTNIKLVLDDPSAGFWAKPDRASYSLDGKNWHHTIPGIKVENRIVYSQVVNSNKIWFAWGPPFTLTNARNLVNDAATKCSCAEVFILAESSEKHPVPALKVNCGKNSVDESPVIWIQARQHAWEAGASWVAQGFIEWLVGTESSAVKLRETAEIIFIPLMDVDNVTTGDGGKKQVPHDHNEDWTDTPIYPAVSAAQKIIRKFDHEGKFQLFVDLHNPGLAKSAYFYYAPFNKMDEKTREATQLFAKSCQNHMPNTLIPFDSKHRETEKIKGKPLQSRAKNWVVKNTKSGVVAATLETSWNSPFSTYTGYKSVGRQLGNSISEYMSNSIE